jgi:hypothetical protein
MAHLRLVGASDDAAAPVEPPAALEPRPLPEDDAVPLLYVPARLMLALAGRCSCPQCCTAFAERRREPHDPRHVDRTARLRAI